MLPCTKKRTCIHQLFHDPLPLRSVHTLWLPPRGPLLIGVADITTFYHCSPFPRSFFCCRNAKWMERVITRAKGNCEKTAPVWPRATFPFHHSSNPSLPSLLCLATCKDSHMKTVCLFSSFMGVFPLKFRKYKQQCCF